MNPCLVLSHNCLALTKRCVESVKSQDIETEVLLYDNASSDGTGDWMRDHIQNGYGENKISGLQGHFSDSNRGVSVGWNWGLNYFFNHGAEHVCVVNNDTIWPSWFLSSLLSYNLPFVTGRETTYLADLAEPTGGELGTGPQFSAFLIRRDAWETIGRFDEAMVSWCSDLDYHYRAHRLGINCQSAPVLYYHERSSTINTAPPKEKRAMQMQADADRLELFRKWGAHAGPEFHALFTPETFGIDCE
jgi:GT2 family glycosyltransferase